MINDAVDKGLITFSTQWIENAKQKRRKNLSEELAYSQLLPKVGKIDKIILGKERLN
jgi:hypothetical protein